MVKNTNIKGDTDMGKFISGGGGSNYLEGQAWRELVYLDMEEYQGLSSREYKEWLAGVAKELADILHAVAGGGGWFSDRYRGGQWWFGVPGGVILELSEFELVSLTDGKTGKLSGDMAMGARVVDAWTKVVKAILVASDRKDGDLAGNC